LLGYKRNLQDSVFRFVGFSELERREERKLFDIARELRRNCAVD